MLESMKGPQWIPCKSLIIIPILEVKVWRKSNTLRFISRSHNEKRSSVQPSVRGQNIKFWGKQDTVSEIRLLKAVNDLRWCLAGHGFCAKQAQCNFCHKEDNVAIRLSTGGLRILNCCQSDVAMLKVEEASDPSKWIGWKYTRNLHDVVHSSLRTTACFKCSACLANITIVSNGQMCGTALQTNER